MTTVMPRAATASVTGCPVKGCPTRSGACAFHAVRYPRGFRDLDRLIRSRPLVGGGE